MVGLKYYSKLEFILSPEKVRVKKDLFVLNVFFYWSIVYFCLSMYNNNKCFIVNQDALKEQTHLYNKSYFLLGFDSMGSFRGKRLKGSKLSRIKPKTLTKKRKARFAMSPIKSPPSKRFI
jgi:hypothetical protein